jgi:hypothetical protein
MPELKMAITAAAGAEAEGRLIRSRALECLSRVAEAVGKETAGVDAAEFLNLIVKNTAKGDDDDDAEAFRSSVTSLTRLANCFGADFAP